jgi:hypothetical protein
VAPDLREAIARQQGALEILGGAAREEPGGGASEAVTGPIRQTLEAAAVDDGAAEAVRQGRLAKELEPAGFGTLAAHAKSARREGRARRTGSAADNRAALAEERHAHKRWQRTQHDGEQAAERVDKTCAALDALRAL